MGVRQARYFGRVKTLFQLLMAATVANLTLVASKIGMMGKPKQSPVSFLTLFYHDFMIAIMAHVLKLSVINIPLPVLVTGKLCLVKRGFRLDF